MAKKKQLTDAQVLELKDALKGTEENIYAVAKAKFKINIDDTAFAQLEKVGLFKCNDCNVWMDTGKKEPEMDRCKACVDAENDDDDDDDDDDDCHGARDEDGFEEDEEGD